MVRSRPHPATVSVETASLVTVVFAVEWLIVWAFSRTGCGNKDGEATLMVPLPVANFEITGPLFAGNVVSVTVFVVPVVVVPVMVVSVVTAAVVVTAVTPGTADDAGCDGSGGGGGGGGIH